MSTKKEHQKLNFSFLCELHETVDQLAEFLNWVPKIHAAKAYLSMHKQI